MKALPLLAALVASLAALPALAPPAASSHGGFGLVDAASPAPAASHLSWSDDVNGKSGAFCSNVGCIPIVPPDLACDGDDCDARALQVHVPPDHWVTHHGGLRVVFYADGDAGGAIAQLRVRDAGGTLVAQDASGEKVLVAYLPLPAEGTYTLEVQGLTAGTYELDAFLESRVRTSPDFLPNLVPRTPTDLRIDDCLPEEVQEEGAQRCLRFANGIANLGEGAIEVRLGAEETSRVVAGGSANWTQRVSTIPGYSRDVAVGAAVFHDAHQHFHYDGLARYVVHHYDLANGTRGALLNDAQKAGFCLMDTDVAAAVDPARPYMGRFTYDGLDCLAPFERGELHMGIAVGWYDLYGADLAEQYVDVHGAPDGVYELVSHVNPEATLLESDLTDNVASVLFRLSGGSVEVLGAP